VKNLDETARYLFITNDKVDFLSPVPWGARLSGRQAVKCASGTHLIRQPTSDVASCTVFLDLNMPETSGSKILSSLADGRQGIDIIVSTRAPAHRRPKLPGLHWNSLD